MSYQFYTADVFSDRLFGGNPLAVFPNAQGLSTAQMQQIAREFNLSETAFVLPSALPGCDRRVRIFTPATELPFAGHPTIGTAFVLATIGQVALPSAITKITFEEAVGAIAVNIHCDYQQPTLIELISAQLPERGPEPPDIKLLAQILSLELTDLLTAPYRPQAFSCGVPYLFVPLRDRQALQRIQFNRDIWQQGLADYWAPQVYALTLPTTTLPTTTLPTEWGTVNGYGRMFAPGLGIREDPATGSAAAALAGYLNRYSDLTQGTLRWAIAQGIEMQRPSLLQIEADKVNAQLVQVRVGGTCVLVSEGQLHIEPLEDRGEVKPSLQAL